ncbi:hypothetical protein [Microbacterium oxydans]|uniref:hypothetical protein n=1 Tax=Microbacterium oxydans TaxID=82380 RepID=UPI00226B7CA2|nr:hypothetical protein [Microbacterium oxydans]WAA66418.1 hypothetical protein MME74_01350 [Microbacterium oxydans]
MKAHFRLSILLAALAAGVIPLAGTAAASADTAALTDSQEAAVRVNMTRGGISPHIQDALIEKIEAGIAPDSLGEASPVDIVTERTPSGTRTIQIFEDGSRTWTEIQTTSAKPSGPTINASISGCRSSGGWKVGCRVGIYDLISSATFVIDYQTSTSARAKVRDMRALTCDNIAGPCTRSGGIKRATQSAAGPAWAELSYAASAGWVHTKGSFGIRVSGTSVTTY